MSSLREKEVLYHKQKVKELEVKECLKRDGLEIEFVSNPSEELQLIAIHQNVLAIGYIENLKINTVLEALKINRGIIKLLPKTFKINNTNIALAAVRSNGMMLQFVVENYRTANVCRAAFNQSIHCFRFIPLKHQQPYMVDKVLAENITYFELLDDRLKTTEVCLSVLSFDKGRYLKRVPSNILTLDFYQKAIQVNPWCIQYIPKNKRTLQLCELAFSLDKRVFRYLTNKTEEMCLEAISFDADLIKYIDSPTSEMILLGARGRSISREAIDTLSNELKKELLNLNADYVFLMGGLFYDYEPLEWELIEYGLNRFVEQIDRYVKKKNFFIRTYFRELSEKYPNHKKELYSYHQQSVERAIELIPKYIEDNDWIENGMTILKSGLNYTKVNNLFKYYPPEY